MLVVVAHAMFSIFSHFHLLIRIGDVQGGYLRSVPSCYVLIFEGVSFLQILHIKILSNHICL